jgi:hypothetical protein
VFKPGDKVKILGKLTKELRGEEGEVLDPPYSRPHGYLRVLLNNPSATHPTLQGVAMVHPEDVEPL